jgi:N-methylhydantoinase B
LDPVRLEVFHHLFAAAAEEMGATLMRSAFSPNIKERRDFSCALFDDQGRTISQAAHIPIHLGSVPLCVEAVRRSVELRPGDAILLNDPFHGGTHLPDVTLVSPVFVSGAKRPDFFTANRAHHADVGGAHPGSMAPADDVHGEGLRIPPVHLVRAGVIDREVLGLVLANMRVPREREGDLLAQWSANLLGERRLKALADEHGLRELRRRCGELMEWTDGLMTGVLAAMPDGRWSFEDAVEGQDGAPVAIRATLTVRGGRVTVDLRETDDQVGGGLNTPRAVALSAVFYCLRLLLPAGTPTNDGVLRHAEVLTRPGSLVDATYPAPVAAGNVETSQRLVDVLLGALAKALPDRIPAASAGTMSNFTFGGPGFTYYETLAGGAGASAAGPGAHALQTHMTNTRNTPIEALETQLPVRILANTVRRGSGGSGRHAGGDGVRRAIRFLAPAEVAWVADRQARGPYGLSGGAAGECGGAVLREAGGRARGLPGKTALSVTAGTEIELSTPGGGGWGRPARRSSK